MNSILVYIHTAEEAKHMIRYAMNMGKNMHMGVALLYTAELQNYPMGIPGAARPTVQITNEHVENLLKEIRNTFESEIERTSREIENPPSVTIHAKQGISHHIIDDFTKKSQISFVLTSAQSDNQFLINDRNMDIIRKIEKPVWIVPEEVSFSTVSSIVYATDYNEEDISTMKRLTDIARINNAKISALHIDSESGFREKAANSGFMNMVREQVGYPDIEVTALLRENGNSLHDSIATYARQVNADLIVTLKENKGFFERLFSRSETKKLIGSAEIPVLVFHEKHD